MHSFARFVASALAVSTTTAVYTGFNYGNTHTDGSIKQQSDYEAEFRTAKNLVGAPGFTSARLYTSVQSGTDNGPIAAIPAAIAQDTSLLLGIWASSGQQTIDSEIAALKSAIDQYGDSFTSRVAGISVGSEDLYRDSVIGIQTNAGIGAGPDAVSSYIDQVRSALSNSGLSVPIGHVDTWTAWVNGSNKAVIDACDFIGFDGYPYFQNTMPNSIDDAKSLFQESIQKTKAAVGDKEVWIAETGWPVSGPTENKAVASLQNAQTYWDEVGCGLLFGQVNTWWYTLRDAEPDVPSPSFGVVGSDLSTTPLYNLTCSGSSKPNSTTTTGAAKPSTGSATSAATGSMSSPSGGSGNGGVGGGSGGGGGSATGSSSSGSSTSPSQGSSGSASGSPSASPSGGAGAGSTTSKPLISPSASGSAGSSSSGAMSSPSASPSASGVASSSGAMNSPSPSASSGAGGMGGSTASAPNTPSASGGAGGGVGGGSNGSGNNQSPSGSSSSPQSSQTIVSAANAAAAPVMYLVGAVTAVLALL